jgi:uncharacterized protein DUF11
MARVGRLSVAALRALLLLWVMLSAMPAAAAGVLWYETKIGNAAPTAVTLSSGPDVTFFVGSQGQTHVDARVFTGSQATGFLTAASLELSTPQALLPGAYEDASLHAVPSVSFAPMGGLCTQTYSRFVVLEAVFNATGVASLAVDFEIQCGSNALVYGELRYNSTVPLTAGKPGGTISPDAFAFSPRNDVLPGALVVSNPTTIYGINSAAPIFITGGEYSVNGGAFTRAPGMVSNRDRVVVRTTASSSLAKTATATLTVGGVAGDFNVTTFTPGVPFTAVALQGTAPWSAPPAWSEFRPTDGQLFAFTQDDGTTLIVLSSVPAPFSSFDLRISGPLTVGPHEDVRGSDIGGLCGPVAGKRFVVHDVARNGALITRLALSFELFCPASPGSPVPDQHIFGEVRINSAMPLPSMVLTADSTPYPFQIRAQSPVRAGAVVQSNVFTIDGVNQPVPISVVGGEYSVNGGPFTSAAGMANPRDEVVVRTTASRAPGATRSATFTAGGVSSTMEVRTWSPTSPLSGFYFRSVPGDHLSDGRTGLYIAPPNTMTLTNSDQFYTYLTLLVHAVGPHQDTWDLALMSPANRVLAIGTYENALEIPGATFTDAGLSFRPTFGCSPLYGRFVVRDASYDANGVPLHFAADVEQRCGSPTAPPLVGEIRFNTLTPFSALVGGECTVAEPDCVADLAISQAVPDTLQLGTDATITLGVANQGTALAHNVVLMATLPSSLTFANFPPPCARGDQVVTCRVDTLAPGASVGFDFSVHAAVPGSFTLSTSVSAEEIDPVPANNSGTASIAVPSPTTIANISTRARVLTGSDVLIGGFIIGGTGTKTVVVTASGPSLVAAGIANALANPVLTLVRSSDGTVLATNDDWAGAPNAAQIQAAGFAPAHARESAIMMTLPPGAYTAIVSGAGGLTGVGLVAVYEVDHPEVPLVNISTRGRVLSGNDVMIGGFIVQGSAPQTVVVTGTGPALAAAGIPNPLANPTLMLVRSADGSVIATNDDWASAPNAAQIQALGLAPANAREPAILVTLPPGAYTAILSGIGGTTGVGIVAVYRVP